MKQRRLRFLWALSLVATLLGGSPAANAPQSEDPQSEDVVPAAPAARSFLTRPLYLGEEPPPCRTLAVLHLACDGPGLMSMASARELAQDLREKIHDAASFRELAAKHSNAPNAGFGAIMGSFAPGVLEKPLEHFLWSAELGEVSAPIERDGAVLLLQRVDRWAGCRLILIKQDDGEGAQARMDAVLTRLQAGEDFGLVAEELSEDADSSARAGAFAVFERGNQDRLVKRAIFEASLGEWVGPLDTPIGLVIAKRVAPDLIEPSLWESNWARVRAILLSYAEASGPIELNARPFSEAQALSQDLAQRLRDKGADMAALAAQYDDDHDGKRRRGDLGWIRRNSPTTIGIIGRVFQEPTGNIIGPLPLQIGFLFLRREDR